MVEMRADESSGRLAGDDVSDPVQGQVRDAAPGDAEKGYLGANRIQYRRELDRRAASDGMSTLSPSLESS